MKSFSKRLSRLGTENAFSVIGKAKAFEESVLKPRGQNLIYLQIGEPGFNTPQNINQAAIQAVKNNATHYTATPGIPELRRAVAKRVSRTTGVPYEREDVVVVSGAKPIIFYMMNALLDPGDEVIVPNPAFPIYGSVAAYLGARVVPLALREKNNFNIDLAEFEKKITPKTKLVVLNTPQNPTGAVFPEKTIRKIAELCKKHDLWVLSDEIYMDMVHQGEHFSIAGVPGMAERTVILNGCSKTYAMTGYRIGWGVTKDKKMLWALERFATNDTSCPSAISQYAALEAITGPQKEVGLMLKEYKKRRDLIVKLANEIPGMKCHSPAGAFYLMVNVREVLERMGWTAAELCDKIMTEAHVLILPGTVFGDFGEDFVRFSYVSTRENILLGMARIKKYVESLTQAKGSILKNRRRRASMVRA